MVLWVTRFVPDGSEGDQDWKHLPRCLVGLEATPGAHYRARSIGSFGLEFG
jgi:hypothetical protein